MNGINRLKQDHGFFRSQLTVLEFALSMGTEARFVWREVSFSLSKHLPSHVKRESEAVTSYSRRLRKVGVDTLEAFSIDHNQEWQIFRFATRCLIQGIDELLEPARCALAKSIVEFRSRMEEQERQLFPLIQEASGACEDSEAGQANRSILTETMTGNYVFMLYPQTQAVFDRFTINLNDEGDQPLDELA